MGGSAARPRALTSGDWGNDAGEPRSPCRLPEATGDSLGCEAALWPPVGSAGVGDAALDAERERLETREAQAGLDGKGTQPAEFVSL